MTEFTLDSYVTWGALLQQGEFDYLKVPEGKNPQIYFIGKRPRISCDVNFTSINQEGLLSGIAIIHDANRDQRIPFALQVISQDKKYPFDLELSYPYTVLKVKSGNSGVKSMTVATAVAMQSQSMQECLDMEVLYIGQSFSGSRNYGIRQRIENHSTLQNIYAEAINKFPNDEVWIGLLHFEIQAHMFIDGMANDLIATPEEDDRHVERFSNGEISGQQIINFTEAALIKYLQPRFNKVYKNIFPSNTHASYSECYELDLSSISVTLVTDCLGCRTYTSEVSANETHFIHFNLHSFEERRTIFDCVV